MKKLSDCRILLVDDTKANLDVLVAGLRAEFKLSLALNGESALQLAARTSPDLILLDVMMPGMDGFEVCRKLRARPEMADVPIVFLSALGEVEDKALGFEVGANDYVTKPFDLLEVKARVRALLKAKAYNDAVKEQIAGELRVAREIQMGMLPHDFSKLGSEHGVTLDAALIPAGEVGGDLFAAFSVGDRLVTIIGDVSGKGIPAALFMVRSLSLVRLLARDIAAPDQILVRLNDELARDNPSCMFVTLVCSVFHSTSGRVVMASAGQPSPILLRPNLRAVSIFEQLGAALGFEPDLSFERKELTLQPGECLLYYTDGVTEAFNPQGECFGQNRLIEALVLGSGLTPAELTSEVVNHVQAFSAGTRQSDDLAVLAMRFDAPVARPTAPPPPRVSLNLATTSTDVMRAVEALRTFAREQNLDDQEVFGLALALEECGSNIVRHTFRGDPTQQFQVTLERTNDHVSVLLSDRGPAVHTDTLDPNLRPSSSDEGGWGLHLVRSFVDEFEYSRRANLNTWRLSKRVLDRAPESVP